MSEQAFLRTLRERARQARRRIVFAEIADPRVAAAVQALEAAGIVTPVVVVDPADPASARAATAFGGEIVDPTADPRRERVEEDLIAIRGGRGLSHDEARRLSKHPLFVADNLVRHGEVDGCVAGAVYTTADVMRAALWMVGAAPGIKTVSSAFYMCVSPFREEGEEVLTFTDCAVIPAPTVEQLVDIAMAAARDRERIVGDTPSVAFLSFSTLGSGRGDSVERMRAALHLLRERAPDVVADGELQGDAALIPAVARRKAPTSNVAGRANILVFPTLDAGNIAYKLVERLGQASAVGPIVQGLNRPCSDLSRGASVDDIMHVAAITALQATADRPWVPTAAGGDPSH